MLQFILFVLMVRTHGSSPIDIIIQNVSVFISNNNVIDKKNKPNKNNNRSAKSLFEFTDVLIGWYK